MKFFVPKLISLLTLLILLPLNVFACACCAEHGHYSISYSNPGKFEIDELKRVRFSAAELYLTAAGRENIKGLTSKSEKFTVKSEVEKNGLNFIFEDDEGRAGSLNLRMPDSMIDFKADIHDGKKGGAGGPLLYKEWRLKYKVRNGTGFFENGIKGKTEYFLVLQGRGNVCTSAEDFTNWRLEISGKNANYAFFGKLKAQSAANPATPTRQPRKAAPVRAAMAVSNLKETNYKGCGCTGIRVKNAETNGAKSPFLRSIWDSQGKGGSAYVNINGKDTEFKISSQGQRPKQQKTGERFTDEFESNGLRLILDYLAKDLPADGANAAAYDITATIIGEYAGKVVELSGYCGC